MGTSLLKIHLTSCVFSGADWALVDDGYAKNQKEVKNWRRFLEILGVRDLPIVHKVRLNYTKSDLVRESPFPKYPQKFEIQIFHPTIAVDLSVQDVKYLATMLGQSF